MRFNIQRPVLPQHAPGSVVIPDRVFSMVQPSMFPAEDSSATRSPTVMQGKCFVFFGPLIRHSIVTSSGARSINPWYPATNHPMLGVYCCLFPTSSSVEARCPREGCTVNSQEKDIGGPPSQFYIYRSSIGCRTVVKSGLLEQVLGFPQIRCFTQHEKKHQKKERKPRYQT